MEKPVVPVAEVMDRRAVFGLAGCAFSASRPGLLSVWELEHRPEVNHEAAPARRRSESSRQRESFLTYITVCASRLNSCFLLKFFLALTCEFFQYYVLTTNSTHTTPTPPRLSHKSDLIPRPLLKETFLWLNICRLLSGRCL